MNHNFLNLLFIYLFVNFPSHVHFFLKKTRIAKKGLAVQLKADPQGIISTMLSEGAFIASCEGVYFQTGQLKNGNLISKYK
jgi:hypothetical protein